MIEGRNNRKHQQSQSCCRVIKKKLLLRFTLFNGKLRHIINIYFGKNCCGNAWQIFVISLFLVRGVSRPHRHFLFEWVVSFVWHSWLPHAALRWSAPWGSSRTLWPRVTMSMRSSKALPRRSANGWRTPNQPVCRTPIFLTSKAAKSHGFTSVRLKLLLFQTCSSTTVRRWSWCFNDGPNWSETFAWRTGAMTSVRFQTSMTAWSTTSFTTPRWAWRTRWNCSGCPEPWPTLSFRR